VTETRRHPTAREEEDDAAAITSARDEIEGWNTDGGVGQS